jgi:site-specific DNA-cytosine methylase
VICLEIFSCAGGMAEGFRRAGITFDLAVDFAPDHCDSYERNLGHRPIAMDVRDMLRLVRAGQLRLEVDLLVADPPCTPWSRAGKRLGTSDKRDMLEVTCELIAALRPRRYLIGNVPGLDDSKHLPIVQRLIGGLSRHGYCTADFARLDAADYGVPQHRVRPFWFGHREGPCVRWMAPTHCDPVELATLAVPGVAPLRPWVTCRDALGHLEPEQLGRPVKMRKRPDHGKQKGSVAERPARTVGTSNLSDGNNLALRRTRHDEPVHTSEIDAPARAITTQCRAPGHATTIVLNGKHAPSGPDEPARTIGAKSRGNGGCAVLSMEPHHPPSHVDEPSMTIRAGSGGGANRAMMLEGESARRRKRPLERPWTRPATTVTARPGLAPPGHHDEDFAIMSLPDAIILSERAAAILQGFPESWVFSGKTKKARWSQIGQAVPPALAEAVARAIVEQDEATRAESGAA